MRWNHLPIDPALALVGAVYLDRATRDEPLAPIYALAVRVGVNRRQVYRWLQDGITWLTAERIAWELGYHPLEIWADAYNAASPFPELERPGYFGGRPVWYQASGAADWYGDPSADPIRTAA